MPAADRAGRAPRRLGLLAAGALAVGVLAPGAAAETAYLIDELLVGIHAERALDSAIIHVVPTGTRLEVHERDEEFARVTTEDGTTGWVDASYITDQEPARIRLAELETEKARLAEALVEAESSVDSLRQQLEQARSRASAAAPGQPEPARLAAVRAEYEERLSRLQAELEREEASRAAVERQYALRNLAVRRDAQGEIEALEAELAEARQQIPAGASGLGVVPGAAAEDAGGHPFGSFAELEAENRRLAEALEAATRDGPATGREGWGWRLSRSPVWRLAGLGFVLLLAFSLGALWVDFRTRRRHGGFRI